MQTPSRWIIITVNLPDETMDRVLMGFWGGYGGSNSWQLNSGIVNVVDEGDAFVFEGRSGSQYRCYKNNYGTTSMSAQILEGILKRADPGTVIVREQYPYE